MNRASPRISLNGYLLGCGKTTPFAAQDIFPDPQALRSHALAKTGWPLRGPRCELGGFLFYKVQLEFQNLRLFPGVSLRNPRDWMMTLHLPPDFGGVHPSPSPGRT